MRGKFGEHQTVRSILKSLPRTVHDDVTRAGIGDDYARLLLRDGGSGDTGAAKSVNVAAGVCCDSGYMGLRLDIARLYNSIRIGGYMPWAAVDTIVMPDDDERRMKKLLRKLAGICAEYGVDIVTGHTEVNSAVAEPIILPDTGVTGLHRRPPCPSRRHGGPARPFWRRRHTGTCRRSCG